MVSVKTFALSCLIYMFFRWHAVLKDIDNFYFYFCDNGTLINEFGCDYSVNLAQMDSIGEGLAFVGLMLHVYVWGRRVRCHSNRQWDSNINSQIIDRH